MRAVALLLSFSLVLAGCAGGNPTTNSMTFTIPTLQLTGSVSGLDAFAIASPDAYYGGNAVLPLFEVSQIPTNQGDLGLTVWGTKDSSGTITAVTQAEVSGIGVTRGTVHVFFDSADVPILFRDDSSGYAIAISSEASSQPTLTLCDWSGNALGQVSVSGTQVGSVGTGGTCRLGPNADGAQRGAQPMSTSTPSLGTVAATDLSSLSNLSKLMSAAAYTAGMAFAMASILKFKTHKDNPTQVPIGTPIALIAVAAALLFLPTILSVSGTTLFGSTSSLVQVDGTEPTYVSESTLSYAFSSPDPTPTP